MFYSYILFVMKFFKFNEYKLIIFIYIENFYKVFYFYFNI